MELIPTNATIFSSRGFRPRVPDPRSVVEVPAGSVWGAADVARLRPAGLVRVGPPASPRGRTEEGDDGAAAPGRDLGADDLTVRTVLWLALAGVPVTGAGLPAAVHGRLEPALLEVLDRVTPGSVTDPGERELLSLALRRRARDVVSLRPHRTAAPVLVLVPEGDLGPALLADLAAQTWPTVLHRADAHGPADAEVAARARDAGALWCTRVRPDVRYGPWHLADLVDALGHSGTAVAHSPQRFCRWRDGSWLEDDLLGVEGPCDGGLEGGSLWYVTDGPVPPEGAPGYAVHGANAVPAGFVTGSGPAALRLHQGRPVVLDWLPADSAVGAGLGGGQGAAVPPSYFCVGTPSRVRSATTASEI